MSNSRRWHCYLQGLPPRRRAKDGEATSPAVANIDRADGAQSRIGEAEGECMSTNHMREKHPVVPHLSRPRTAATDLWPWLRQREAITTAA